MILWISTYIRFALTGAGSSAESRAYEEVGSAAGQHNRINEEPLYESMDVESVL